MKLLFLSFLSLIAFSLTSKSQVIVSKLIGKDAGRYGLGFGGSALFDFQLATENKSFRLDLELIAFPEKKHKLSTAETGYKTLVSVRGGYKYVFSETQLGLYVVPSAGYSRLIIEEGGQTAGHSGIAGALEVGYTFELGQMARKFNVGLKYEYDGVGSSNTIQSIGFRLMTPMKRLNRD
ncbi:MAG TPA: hypothetical protein VM843_03140 [Flavisolibacter sp.]|jgi:hypothetical protein|nr:hypothetical protein [Flavisolibacter sp.]